MLFIPIIILSLIVGLSTFILFIFVKNEILKKTSAYCIYIDFYFILFYSILLGVFLLLKSIKIYTIPHGLDTYIGLILFVLLLIIRKPILLFIFKNLIILNIILVLIELIAMFFFYENYNPNL